VQKKRQTVYSENIGGYGSLFHMFGTATLMQFEFVAYGAEVVVRSVITLKSR